MLTPQRRHATRYTPPHPPASHTHLCWLKVRRCVTVERTPRHTMHMTMLPGTDVSPQPVPGQRVPTSRGSTYQLVQMAFATPFKCT